MTWSVIPNVSGGWTVVSDASVSYSEVSAVSNTYSDVGPGPGYVRGGYVVGGYIEPQSGTDWTDVDEQSTTWA
jgi:hypothetical protein